MHGEPLRVWPRRRMGGPLAPTIKVQTPAALTDTIPPALPAAWGPTGAQNSTAES